MHIRTALTALLAGLLGIGLADPAAAQLSKAEIEKKLAQTKVALSVDKAPLDQVLSSVQQMTGVPIVLDARVTQSRTAEELQVTLKVSELPAIEALKLLVKLKNLELGIADGAVRIQGRVGKPAATVTRRFYVGDLALALRDFPGPPLGSGFYAHPPRYRLGLPAGDAYALGYPYRSTSRLRRYDYGYGRHYGPYYGGDLYYGADLHAVPLGTPYYESVPTFQRPPYQGRWRHAPFAQENLGEIQALVRDLKAATGGDANWSRPGVGVWLDRGSVLIVKHTPLTVEQVAARLKARRSQPPRRSTYPMKLR